LSDHLPPESVITFDRNTHTENGINDIQDIAGRETRVREQLAQRGYRLMNRGRRGEYWLMYSKPATLEGFLEHMDQRLRQGNN
jgi:proline dehydrogenase